MPNRGPITKRTAVGDKYGQWLVLRKAIPFRRGGKHRHDFWICRCLRCKRVKTVDGAAMRFGGTRSCKKCATATQRRRTSKKNIIGKKFGGWTVAAEIPRADRPDKRYGNKAWLCRCKCGKEKALSIFELNSNTCGCRRCAFIVSAPKRRLRPYESLYNATKKSVEYRVFKKRTQVEFTLTYEDFLRIIKSGRCHYCHLPLVWARHDMNNNGSRYYLDRKDNDLGYTRNNSVPCCTRCNYAKSNKYTHGEWWAMNLVFRVQRP